MFDCEANNYREKKNTANLPWYLHVIYLIDIIFNNIYFNRNLNFTFLTVATSR